MTPRGRNAGEPRKRDPAADGAGRRQAREELDRKLDEALDATFPASDALDLLPRGRNSGEPA
jgi:hypothetical protein